MTESIYYKIIIGISGIASFLIVSYVLFIWLNGFGVNPEVSTAAGLVGGVLSTFVIMSSSGIIKEFTIKGASVEFSAKLKEEIEKVQTNVNESRKEIEKSINTLNNNLNQNLNTSIQSISSRIDNVMTNLNISSSVMSSKMSVDLGNIVGQVYDITKQAVSMRMSQMGINEVIDRNRQEIPQDVLLLKEAETKIDDIRQKVADKPIPYDIQKAIHDGILLYYTKDYEGSLKAFDEILAHDPKNVSALVNRGIILGTLGRYEEAIKSYDEALKIMKDNFVAWYDRGLDLTKSGKHDEAIKSFEEAIKIKSDADAWNSKGTALIELGKSNEAIKSFEEAIKIKANHLNAWYNKGVTLERLGNINESIKCFEKYLQFDSKSPDVMNHLAWILASSGRDEEAVSLVRKALQLEEKNAYLHTLGYALHNLGEYAGSIAAYDRALQLAPNYARVWYDRARAKLKLKDKNGALVDLAKAIEIEGGIYRDKVIGEKEFDDLRNLKEFAKLVKAG